ncbi:MAG: hypothetical protein Q4A25_00435 [Candidatus Saccharibacteria bacterium]|nr:hypothetical protein [Candidatus Saccharibacteria bacterium]
MDVIFKIAGWMILILIGLVGLMVLINNWEDIILFFSNLSSTSTKEESGEQDKAEQFKEKVFDILKYKGQYDPKLQLKVYSDSNITIYEDKRITWKHKSGNPREDCVEYIDRLYSLCHDREYEMSQSIQVKARKILASNEEFQSGNLRLYSGERSSSIRISVAGQLVFCQDNIDNHISTYRPGKWEQELDRILEKRLDESEKQMPELFMAEKERKQREAEEEIRKFSPIDDSAYF